MIIDTHAQLWTAEALQTLPPAMKKSYEAVFAGLQGQTLETTIQDMDAAGVDKSVVVAIDAETTYNYRVPDELVAQAVASYPDRLIGFAGGDPHKGKAAARALERAVKELGLKGLKLMPHLAELNPNDRQYYPLYEKACELDIPVLLHMGTQYHAGTRIKYCHPLYMDDVAIDFPDLKIIIAHFGWPWTGDTIAVALRHKNVYFNIAGWAPRHIPEDVIKYMNGPLSGKALFGSDFPLVSRQRIIKELRELPLKEKTLTRLLTENPRKVLKL